MLQHIQSRLIDLGQKVGPMRFRSKQAKADLDAILKDQSTPAPGTMSDMIPKTVDYPAAK